MPKTSYIQPLEVAREEETLLNDHLLTIWSIQSDWSGRLEVSLWFAVLSSLLCAAGTISASDEITSAHTRETIMPDALDVFVDVASLSDGKDKLSKIVQYLLKLIIWRRTILKREPWPEVTRIQKLLSEGRKAFRCTETFKDLKAAREPLEEDIHSSLGKIEYASNILSVLSSFSESFCFISKLCNWNVEKVKKWEPWGDVCWAISCVCDLVLNHVARKRLETRRTQLSAIMYMNSHNMVTSEGEKEKEKMKKMDYEMNTLQINQYKLTFDLIAAYLFARDIDDQWPGTIAITGIFSACLGLLKLIRKSKLKLGC
ncbi:peroxisomal biogenesis factor 11 family protein [Planoprotostelium fungivorum]|uniref:Peroxisomal biogenesis factor 11 family protein n=1 Tax=Planoprotostelium fungivorum TaxID=1890364 RepID=A0A2P6N076_9EUKA|nr:peroxisomal biogenesis factor 11 family protein [Planoprotostelium fungivorum]